MSYLNKTNYLGQNVLKEPEIKVALEPKVSTGLPLPGNETFSEANMQQSPAAAQAVDQQPTEKKINLKKYWPAAAAIGIALFLMKG